MGDGVSKAFDFVRRMVANLPGKDVDLPAFPDVVRRLHPETDGPYSWWSWRGQSFANDTGWRIDYHLATPGLAARAVTGGTDRDADYDSRLSDHAPVVVDYAG